MSAAACDIGVIGLGVMGRNLALNIADHGFAVAGLDRAPAKVQALRLESAGRRIEGAENLRGFVAALRSPRAVLLLVPAGKPVDDVLAELRAQLAPGDLILDGGNSHFADTDRRLAELQAQGIRFLGLGISGGEAGARHGPSLMPGGAKEAYERVRSLLEAVAAKVEGVPCVAYLGPGSAGHYVKMVHNGIEYGLMQLLAETYDWMRRGLGLSNDELHAVYQSWQHSELSSFLLEITARIFLKVDPRTGNRLIDLILDVARQKGTGKWTSQHAMDLQSPIPIIDAAVSLRDLSAYDTERAQAAKLLPGPSPIFSGDRQAFLNHLKGAFHAAMILTYVQGLALLRRASQTMKYGLDLASVARIWRGGCIIHAALLDDIRATYQQQPDLPNLLLAPHFAEVLGSRQMDLRATVGTAADLGLPAPGLMASLAYYDAYRSARLPTNLIQAQRDFFGAHTYERVDDRGTFHTAWD